MVNPALPPAALEAATSAGSLFILQVRAQEPMAKQGQKMRTWELMPNQTKSEMVNAVRVVVAEEGGGVGESLKTVSHQHPLLNHLKYENGDVVFTTSLKRGVHKRSACFHQIIFVARMLFTNTLDAVEHLRARHFI